MSTDARSSNCPVPASKGSGRRRSQISPGHRPRRSNLLTALTALEVEGFALRGRFTAERRRTSGASAAFSPASTIARSIGCAPRSSPSPPAISFASCSTGSGCAERQMKDAVAVRPSSRNSKVSRAAASAGERNPARAPFAGYQSEWLDERCTAGQVAWTRRRPTRRPAAGRRGDRSGRPVRTTPIALFPRRHAPLWASLPPRRRAGAKSARRPRPSIDCIRENGASFFDETDGRHAGLPCARRPKTP